MSDTPQESEPEAPETVTLEVDDVTITTNGDDD